MSSNQNATKKSHKKKRRKVSDLLNPSTTYQEQSGPNEDSSPPVINNTGTQASQSSHHHAVGALLTLSSSPGRVRPPSTTTTPFHSIVDSIVGGSPAPSLSQSLQSEESSAVLALYSLGIRNRDVVPPTGNAPTLVFGTQVSPSTKRQRPDASLDPSRRLLFDTAAVQGQSSTPTVELSNATNSRATAIAAGTANLSRYSNQNRIYKNPERVILALRRLEIPAPATKRRKPVPSPLIRVHPEAPPLQTDYTKNNCASLITRLRNPLSIKNKPVPSTIDAIPSQATAALNKRQQASHDAKSKPVVMVPERLHSVTSFGLRTLIIEDILQIPVGTPVIVFSIISKTKDPQLDNKWRKAHVMTQQGLPDVTGIGAGFVYRQVQGYVVANPRADDLIGRAISDIVQRVCDVFQKEGINIMCPPGPNGKAHNMLLTYHELFFYPRLIFLQAELPHKVKWGKAILDLKPAQQKLALHRYLQEAGVDRTLIADAVIQWRGVETNSTKLELEHQVSELETTVSDLNTRPVQQVPNLLTDSVKNLCAYIDAFVDGIGQQCFGTFTRVHERILLLDDMHYLIELLGKYVPEIQQHYMDHLGYAHRLKRDERNGRRLRQYKKNVFWKFFLDCRQSNSVLLSKMAIIMAAAAYVRGDGSLSNQTMVFFGISVSKTTLMAQLSKWSNGMEDNVKKALARLNFFMVVFDNLQKGLEIRNMFGGSCNFFSKLTAAFYLEPYLMILPKGHEQFDWRVALTYLFQVIPSAYGLPAFEILPFLLSTSGPSTSSLSSTVNSNAATSINSYDALFASVATEATVSLPHDIYVDPFNPSGTRTRAYITAVETAAKLDEQYRFFSVTRRTDQDVDYYFQPVAFATSDVRKMVATKLRSLRGTTGLYRNAGKFQATTTKSWRGTPPPARILFDTVSVLDETTKKGASALLISFMIQSRIIEKNNSTNMYVLCENWNQQTLALVGDGLSLDRIRQFFEDIKEISDGTITSFKDAYRQSLVFVQALSRVVPIPGDLHTRFHQLDAIYRTFWGGFLQAICWRLGWKKVKGTDVPGSYSSCHMLADCAYRCVIRLLMDIHIHVSFNTATVSALSAEALAVNMATTFHTFVQDIAVNSKDWVLRFTCQFVLRMFDYLLMLQSERVGDSIVIEDCYTRFLPLMSFTGKRNYFELTCNQMEWHYTIPANLLHQVRINRMRRQTSGTDQDGNPTPNSAMDLHIERMMPVLKAVRHRNTAESWVHLSKCIPFCMKCRKFTDAEMSKRRMLDFVEAEEAQEAGKPLPNGTKIADPTYANKRTVIPNKTKSLVLITEGLVLAGITEVKANRRFDDMHFWKAFNATTTDITETRRVREAKAGEQRLRDVSNVETEICGTVETIFDGVAEARQRNRLANDGDGNDDTNIGDVDDKSLYDNDEADTWINGDQDGFAGESVADVNNDIIDTVNEYTSITGEEDDDNIDIPETLDEYEHGEDVVNEDNESANGDDVNSNLVTDDEIANEIRKKVKMKIEPMNKAAATTDFYNDEIAKLQEENIVTLRSLKREREARSNEFLKKQLYERLITMEQTGITPPAASNDSTMMKAHASWKQYLLDNK